MIETRMSRKQRDCLIRTAFKIKHGNLKGHRCGSGIITNAKLETQLGVAKVG